MIVLKKLTQLNKIYPEASLGTQRRTMLGNNSRKAGKKVAQAVGLGAAAKAGGWMGFCKGRSDPANSGRCHGNI